MIVDAHLNITGVGDNPRKKDAEKLAALSAVLQLDAAGAVRFPARIALTTARESSA